MPAINYYYPPAGGAGWVRSKSHREYIKKEPLTRAQGRQWWYQQGYHGKKCKYNMLLAKN